MGISPLPVALAPREWAEWPRAETALWDWIEMPPGYYGPCHRPMCVGAPLRFGAELEAAANRLYFPLADRLPTDAPTPHLLVFVDPSGRTHTASVPCGRHSPAGLCAALQTDMTRAAEVLCPGVRFRVTHDDDRFAFACTRRDADGRDVPACFGLLFHHPLCLDPARLGFEAQPLSGAHTYVAPKRTHCALARNLLRVDDSVAQKRFRLHATHAPPMVAEGMGTRDGVARCARTSTSCPSRTATSPATWSSSRSAAAPRCCATGRARSSCREQRGAALRLLVRGRRGRRGRPHAAAPRSEPRRVGRAGTCVQVAGQAAPWSVRFGAPRSLPPALVGFPARAMLWGVDGSVRDADGLARPPYEAPHTHSLDHPDYVLITFSEQAGTLLEHTYGGESKSVFTKLALYPQFREERMLPRDTALRGGHLSRFTIAFWNPDMRTPYRSRRRVQLQPGLRHGGPGRAVSEPNGGDRDLNFFLDVQAQRAICQYFSRFC